MNPRKVVRQQTKKLTDLPNIGKVGAADLNLLGIEKPSDLVGRDPYEMYADLCIIRGCRQDPCVIDVFISVTRFVGGDDPKPWWAYSAERKQAMQGRREA